MAYARRVVVNECLSHLRRHRPETPDRRRCPTGSAPTRTTPPDLGAALAALPDRQRAIVALRFLDDLPVAEVGRLLGIADGTVKSQTARALETLRQRLPAPAPRGDPMTHRRHRPGHPDPRRRAPTEPTHGLDAMVPVRLGRRRLRARRLQLAGAAAAVVAVGRRSCVAARPAATTARARPTLRPPRARPRPTPWPSHGCARRSAQRRSVPTSAARERPPASGDARGRRGLGGDRQPGGTSYTVTADSAGRLDDPAAYCRERRRRSATSRCTVDHDASGRRRSSSQELLVVQRRGQADGRLRPQPGTSSFARMPGRPAWTSVNPADRFFRREVGRRAPRPGTLTVDRAGPGARPAARRRRGVRRGPPATDLVAVAG